MENQEMTNSQNVRCATQRDKMTGRGLMVLISIFLADVFVSIQIFNIAPVMTVMMDDLSMSLSVANLSNALIFLFMAGGMFFAPPILEKYGLKASCIIGILCGMVGCLVYYISVNVIILFVARVLVGAAVGMMFATISAVIVTFFGPRFQPFLNGLYGGMPYVGNLVAIAFTVPLLNALDGSWRGALGIWGAVLLLPLILWLIFAYKRSDEGNLESGKVDTSAFRYVWQFRNIRLMTLVYSCDMIVFGFTSGVIPTYLIMDWGATLEMASKLNIAFPLLGVIFAFSFGAVITATGRRKIPLITGQLCKTVGLILLVLPVGWLRVIGIGLLGGGSALWMPSFYTIIMDQKELNPSQTAAAVALASAIPYVIGCVFPYFGGMLVSAIGFKFTFLVWIIPALVGLMGGIVTRETGIPVRRNKKQAA